MDESATKPRDTLQAPGFLRRRNGQFAPSTKGGPGRPKSCRELVGSYTRDGHAIIETLVEIMSDKRARNADRIRAAELLKDRYYGKAPEIHANAQIDLGAQALAELTREQLEELILIGRGETPKPAIVQ